MDKAHHCLSMIEFLFRKDTLILILFWLSAGIWFVGFRGRNSEDILSPLILGMGVSVCIMIASKVRKR